MTARRPDQLRVHSEPEPSPADDEQLAQEAAAAQVHQLPAQPTLDDEQLRAVALPLGDAPGGTAFGTLVHTVLEQVDFTADDLAGQLAAHAEEHVRPGGAGVLADGLNAALRTPLGPLLDDRPLHGVPARDRLDELEFELPLAVAGDAAVSVAAIGRLLARHLRRADPLAGYAAHLREAGSQAPVRGFLTGSIDLVLRHTGTDGSDRFFVVDYKTNRLGAPGEPLTAWHYRRQALIAGMVHGHYPLQALLYQVALHRFLRWRLPGYQPDQHLGGVLYLFLRGMIGPATPTVEGHPCGVFSWQPPVAVVTGLSDLLDRGATP